MPRSHLRLFSHHTRLVELFAGRRAKVLLGPWFERVWPQRVVA